MGEDIELTDVDGKTVRVGLYCALRAIGETLGHGESKTVARKDGRGVEVRLNLPAEAPAIV
jgi:hypothetical protein